MTGLRVGIVARCLNAAHVRGMGRYVQEVLRQSAHTPGLAWRLYGNDRRYPLVVPPGVAGEADVFSFRGDRFELWEQIGLPLRCRGSGIDVLHCTEGSLPWWQPVPTVVTVHDTLAWEERGPGRFERWYFDHLQVAALHRAAAVITISESSRRDIVARWPGLAAKLSVIPHGIGDEYFDDDSAAELPLALQQTLGDRPYALYLGGPLARKRFDWAVELLARSPRSDLQLLACGFGAAAVAPARDAVPEALRARVHFAPFLSDRELVAAYRGAAVALYPTLYEGFGFPVVEAQAAGAPILFAAAGSLAELVGPLSYLLPAEDRAAWDAALAEALALPLPARRQRADAAREWARRYSWRHSFEAHLAVYREVAARRAKGRQ